MLRTASLWMGKAPVLGQETGKMMPQAYTGVLVVAVWVLLGGLLLMANMKGVMPARVGFVSWLLLLVSGLAALVAIAAMYDLPSRWAIAIPALIPILVALYVVYLFLPAAQVIAPATAGFVMWGVALAIGILPLPAAFRLAQSALDDGTIESKPGPKMDRWMAEQRESRRLRGLEELRRVDDETTLGDLQSLVRDDSPVRSEALEAMRHLPKRQAQAEEALLYQYTWFLPLLPDIDVQPTPQLCQSALRLIRSYANKLPSRADIRSIGWIAAHCDCERELDQLEEAARSWQDTPAVGNRWGMLLACPADVARERHAQ